MLTDEMLEDLLRDAGDAVPVPEGGLAQVRARLERDSVDAAAVTTATGVRRFGRAGGAKVPLRRRLEPAQWVGLAAGVLVLAAIGGGLTLAVNSDGGAHQTSSASGPMVASEPASAPGAIGAPAAPGTDGSSGKAEGGLAGAVPPAAAEPRVVKTATVGLRVAKGKVGAALDELRSLPGRYDGFVASSNSQLDTDNPSGDVTLRVPVAAYGQVRTALTGGSLGEVTAIRESGQDVTAAYTDLTARIAALEATRQQYLTLLSKATTIGDTLAVQAQLTTVQTQIEQLQGQQKLLGDQSSYATFTVSVSETGRAAIAPSTGRSGFDRAWHDATSTFMGGIQGLVAASGVLLLIAIFATLLLLGGLRLRRVWRRMLV